MNKSEWTVPKWPFLLAYVVAFVFAAILIFGTPRPINQASIYWAGACVIIGSALCCLPFILEYRAAAKLLEMNSLTSVVEQLEQLEKFAEQVSTATEQWVRVQENTQVNADKTVAAAREIAERMTAEIREFNEFQAKLNDNEKAALRLEVEKLHRAEGDWLQVVARILDHTYALHNAAVRSGQGEVAAQIGHFQNACRDVARRVGLTPFVAVTGEKFQPERHRAHGEDNPPLDSIVEETLAPGLTFQGRLVRPVLVSLQSTAAPAAEVEPSPEMSGEKPAAGEISSAELRLEAD
jgi:hypothetical protein